MEREILELNTAQHSPTSLSKRRPKRYFHFGETKCNRHGLPPFPPTGNGAQTPTAACLPKAAISTAKAAVLVQGVLLDQGAQNPERPPQNYQAKKNGMGDSQAGRDGETAIEIDTNPMTWRPPA